MNIAAVFTVTALWHSYDVNFALWGMMLTGFLTAEMVRSVKRLTSWQVLS